VPAARRPAENGFEGSAAGASRGALEFYTAWGGIPRYWELAVAVAADQLHAQVPKELPTGQVRLIVLLSGEDDAGGMWAHGIAAAWSAQVQDPREDMYTLDDGQPVNAPR
jgi:hypothetical protein